MGLEILILRIVLGGIFGVAAIALGWLAYASRNFTLRRNYYAGYRTRTVMHSDRTWRAGHYAAWRASAAAAIIFAISALLHIFVKSEADLRTLAIATLLLSTIAIVSGAVLAQRAARRAAAGFRTTPHGDSGL